MSKAPPTSSWQFDLPSAGASDGLTTANTIPVELRRATFPVVTVSYRGEGLAGLLDLRRPSLSTTTLPPSTVLLARQPSTPGGQRQSPVELRWFLNPPKFGFFSTQIPTVNSSGEGKRKPAPISLPSPPSSDLLYQIQTAKNALKLLSPGLLVDPEDSNPASYSSAVLVGACCANTFALYACSFAHLNRASGSAGASSSSSGTATSFTGSEHILTLTLNKQHCTSHIISLVAALSHNSDTAEPVGSNSTYEVPAGASAVNCVYDVVVVLGFEDGDIVVFSASQERCLRRINSSKANTPQMLSGASVTVLAQVQSSVQQCVAVAEAIVRQSSESAAATFLDGGGCVCTALFAAGFDNGEILLFTVSSEGGDVIRHFRHFGTNPITSMAVLGFLDVFSHVSLDWQHSDRAPTALLIGPAAANETGSGSFYSGGGGGSSAAGVVDALALPLAVAVGCKRGAVVIVGITDFQELASSYNSTPLTGAARSPSAGVSGGRPVSTSVTPQLRPVSASPSSSFAPAQGSLMGEVLHACWLLRRPPQCTAATLPSADWVLATCGEDDRITTFSVQLHPSAAGAQGGGTAGSAVPPMKCNTPTANVLAGPIQSDVSGAPTPTHAPSSWSMTLLQRIDHHRSWTCNIAFWELDTAFLLQGVRNAAHQLSAPAQEPPTSVFQTIACLSHDRTLSLWLQQDMSQFYEGTLMRQRLNSFKAAGEKFRTPQLRFQSNTSVSTPPPQQHIRICVRDDPLIGGAECADDEDIALRLATCNPLGLASYLITMSHRGKLQIYAARSPEVVV